MHANKKYSHSRFSLLRLVIPFVFVLPATVIIYFQLWWMLAGLLVAGAVIGFLVWKKSFLEKASLYYLLIFSLVFALSVIIRVFVLEIYSIPSSSMENTLYPGDKIIVSKLKYGPRMPASPFEIPWVNLFFYLNAQARERIDKPWWNSRRLTGMKKVERGDVVVFKFPDNKSEHFIKRCVAVPGDTLRIKNGIIFINGHPMPVARGIKRRYELWYADREKAVRLLDSLGINFYPSFTRDGGRFFEITISSKEAERLRRASCTDSLAVKVTSADTVSSAYPWDKEFPWTPENFGPLVIPEKGIGMILDRANFALYRKPLFKFDCDSLKAKKIETTVNSGGRVVYTFKKNYYFMMGDNRYGSNDSRFWGLVPEDYIIGNAVIVLFSTDGKRAFSRIFRTIE